MVFELCEQIYRQRERETNRHTRHNNLQPSTHTHIHKCFTAPWILSGTTQVSQYQKKHSPTLTYRGHHSQGMKNKHIIIHCIFSFFFCSNLRRFFSSLLRPPPPDELTYKYHSSSKCNVSNNVVNITHNQHFNNLLLL